MHSPLFALLALAFSNLCFADAVNVTVYYESLCPDSQKFINQQLYPTFITPLRMNIVLALIPYGNANTTDSGITCQHGPVECYGNRVQACAIKKETDMDKQFGFINCLMKMAFDQKPGNESDYKNYIKSCGNWTTSADSIESCADNMEEYNPLMYTYGNMTKQANPPIKGVPTTFFDGKSSKDINDKAMSNFKGQLCSYIKDPKPNECSSGKGSSGEILASAALVISALTINRLH